MGPDFSASIVSSSCLSHSSLCISLLISSDIRVLVVISDLSLHTRKGLPDCCKKMDFLTKACYRNRHRQISLQRKVFVRLMVYAFFFIFFDYYHFFYEIENFMKNFKFELAFWLLLHNEILINILHAIVKLYSTHSTTTVLGPVVRS